MSKISENDVKEALRVIIDPDFGKDIVSLGFVKNVVVAPPVVEVTLELTTPACPVKDEFKAQAEAALKALPGIETVKVTMTAPAPKPTAKTSAGLKGVKQIIAVASCKGGVGKSTVAGMLARELARRGYLTGLLDADIYGPSLPTMFGIHQPELYATPEKLLVPPEGPSGLKLMSFGFLLGDQPAILRGPLVSGYIQQLVGQVDWGPLDYLIIDMPPGTGDVQLTLTQQIQINGAVIVTTHQSLSLVDVAKGILMFEKVNVPILGVVENLAYLECGHCGEKSWPFGKPVNTLKERFGLPTLAEFPIRPDFGGSFAHVADIPVVSAAVDNIIRALGRRSAEAITPPVVENGPGGLVFRWGDGGTSTLTAFALRASCECAHCVDEHTGERILNDGDIPVDIKAESISPLGNYAVSVVFSDGHGSGIHPYARIRKLWPA